MTFKLHTSDIQKLTIALIYANGIAATISEDDYNRLTDKLAELNKLCNGENRYTLTIDVKS